MNSNPRRLFRSADDRILAGVAGGLAAYFDVDPVIVRIIWFVSLFPSAGMTGIAYLVMIVVVPLEPTDWTQQTQWGGGPGAMPGNGPSSGPAAGPVGGPLPGGAPGFAASYTPPADFGTVAPDAAAGADAATTDPATPAAPAPDGTQPGPETAGFAAAPGQPTQSWGDPRWQRRQERWQRKQERWEQRAARREGRGPGLFLGLVLIVVGGLLAWHQVDPNFDLNLTWPLVIMGVGGLIVASSVRFNRD